MKHWNLAGLIVMKKWGKSKRDCSHLINQIIRINSNLYITIFLTFSLVGCGIYSAPSQGIKDATESVYHLKCDSFTSDEPNSKSSSKNASLLMAFKVDKKSMTATLDLKTIDQSESFERTLHLRVFDDPPDLTKRSDDIVYIAADDDKNDDKFSLDIKINKKNGNIEFKPGPDSPLFKGTCARTS